MSITVDTERKTTSRESELLWDNNISVPERLLLSLIHQICGKYFVGVVVPSVSEYNISGLSIMAFDVIDQRGLLSS